VVALLLAENAAKDLQQRTRVIVTVCLRQRSHETKEGEKRTIYEVEVEEMGES
jgi:single-stranded DNA-binding protein